MERASRILLVRGDKRAFDAAPYAARLLAEEWRKRRITVDEVEALSGPVGAGVLVFPHFDVTRMPAGLAEQLSQCPRVVNRAVLDISKRLVSRQLVASPDAYDGEVIVKSNLNYGAQPEVRQIEREGGAKLARLEALRKQPWMISGLFMDGDYPVFATPREVPPRVWSNPSLVVEKFLPERQGEHYCLRQYVFCGSSEFNLFAVSNSPVIKSSNVIRKEMLDAAHPAVRAYREQLGFDYGKFDYVVRDGEAIIFDVNRTYSAGRNSGDAPKTALLAKLAGGIDALLGE